jgi:hypothetical protein
MIHAMCETDDAKRSAASSRIMDPIWRRRQFKNSMIVSHGMYTILDIV